MLALTWGLIWVFMVVFATMNAQCAPRLSASVIGAVIAANVGAIAAVFAVF
jgi:hypothetical protein